MLRSALLPYQNVVLALQMENLAEESDGEMPVLGAGAPVLPGVAAAAILWELEESRDVLVPSQQLLHIMSVQELLDFYTSHTQRVREFAATYLATY